MLTSTAEPGWPPLVSVITPAHRLGALSTALRSVEEQTLRSHEHLVNRCETWSIEKINRLGQAASGRWRLLLCDDDALKPHCLERLVRAAEATGAQVAFSDVEVHDERTGDTYVASPGPFDESAPRRIAQGQGWVAPGISSLVDAAVWDELKGFSATQLYYDLHFWLRALRQGAKFVHVPEPLWRYTARPTTVDRAEAHRRILEAFPDLKAA